MNKILKTMMIIGVVLILGALTVGISANMNDGPDYKGEAVKAVEDAIKNDAGDSGQYYTDFEASNVKVQALDGYHVVTGKMNYELASMPTYYRFTVELTHNDGVFEILKVKIGEKVIYTNED